MCKRKAYSQPAQSCPNGINPDGSFFYFYKVIAQFDNIRAAVFIQCFYTIEKIKTGNKKCIRQI
jgi:hypothetical protein